MSKFKLYASDGITLIYTFPLVQETNTPQSPFRYVGIEGVRGKGELVIPAGTPSWDAEIRGLFMIEESDEGYEDIMDKIGEIEDAIVLNTNYYLRVEKTASPLTYYEYKVRRTEPIEYPTSLRTDSQEYIVRLKVNAW